MKKAKVKQEENIKKLNQKLDEIAFDINRCRPGLSLVDRKIYSMQIKNINKKRKELKEKLEQKKKAEFDVNAIVGFRRSLVHNKDLKVLKRPVSSSFDKSLIKTRETNFTSNKRKSYFERSSKEINEKNPRIRKILRFKI